MKKRGPGFPSLFRGKKGNIQLHGAPTRAVCAAIRVEQARLRKIYKGRTVSYLDAVSSLCLGAEAVHHIEAIQ